MTSTKVLAGLVLLAPWVAPAWAQACAGSLSLQDSRLQFWGSAASYTYATAFGISATAGRDWHVTLGVGRTRDAEMDASTYPVSLEGGGDLRWGSPRFFFCPVAALTVSLGPREYALEERTFRFVDVSTGAGAAGVALRTPRLSVVLTGALRIVHASAKGWYTGNSPYSAGSWNATDDYGLLIAGVGVTVDGVLTLRPTVTVPFAQRSRQWGDWIEFPFGRERNEVVFGIALGIAAGRLKPGRGD